MRPLIALVLVLLTSQAIAQSGPSDAELLGQGYVRQLDADGTYVWRQPKVTNMAGCANGSCGTMAQRGGSGWNPAPRHDQPRPVQAPDSTAAPKPSPQPSPIASIDYDKLAGVIVEKLASDKRFRGPAGPAGKDGSDGVDGKPGVPGPKGEAGPAGRDADEDAIVAAVLAKIDYAKIAAMVKTTPPPQTTAEVHYAVVGLQSANYWPRVSGQLQRAQNVYYGIAAADPPANYTGVLPVLVKYTNGIPQYVARGEFEVVNALVVLERGETL